MIQRVEVIRIDIALEHRVAGRPQPVGDRFPADQRHFPLTAGAAAKNCDAHYEILFNSIAIPAIPKKKNTNRHQSTRISTN
jgi:hypothetical protein